MNWPIWPPILCSPYADYIDGETVTIDGGTTWNHPAFDWQKL
ncbi:MAG: hypothetical protein ABIZ80_12620 [Bryobacteraceae bacterium]